MNIDFLVLDILMETAGGSTTESSDENEEELVKDPPTKIVRIKNFVEETVQQYSDVVFQEHFRMCRRVANFLIDSFAASAFKQLSVGGREQISSKKAILLTLWYLANTETFRQVADRFHVSLSSAHRCLVRVVKFIVSIKHEYIVWPSIKEAKYIAKQFKCKQGIGNIIGAIDGSHIKINKPKLNQDSYINRKGYHSVLLQGVVDHRKMFTDVYCGEPGSLHDARLLRKSSLYKRSAENENDVFYGMFLLGDSAYPCLNWIVPPFKDNGNLTAEQKIFNYKHSSTRMCIENAFGLLKGRFRRLLGFENLDIHLIVQCIMACCVLHNMCLKLGDDSYVSEVSESPDSSTENYADHSSTSGNNRREEVFSLLRENM